MSIASPVLTGRIQPTVSQVIRKTRTESTTVLNARPGICPIARMIHSSRTAPLRLAKSRIPSHTARPRPIIEATTSPNHHDLRDLTIVHLPYEDPGVRLA